MSQPTPGMLYQRLLPVPEGVSVELLLQKWNPGVPDHALAGLMNNVLRLNNLQSLSQIQPNQEILLPTLVPPGMTPRQWRESQPDRPKRKPFQVGDAKFDAPVDPEQSQAANLTPAPVSSRSPSPIASGRSMAVKPAPAPVPSASSSVPPRPMPSSTGKFVAQSSTGKFAAPSPTGKHPIPSTGQYAVPSTGRYPTMPPVNPNTKAAIARTNAGASLAELKMRQAASQGPWQASNAPGQTMGGSEVKEQFQKKMQEEIWKKWKMAKPFSM